MFLSIIFIIENLCNVCGDFIGLINFLCNITKQSQLKIYKHFPSNEVPNDLKIIQ